MADAKVHADGDFEQAHLHIKRGDVIGLVGYPGKSKKGELSIFPVMASVGRVGRAAVGWRATRAALSL